MHETQHSSKIVRLWEPNQTFAPCEVCRTRNNLQRKETRGTFPIGHGSPAGAKPQSTVLHHAMWNAIQCVRRFRSYYNKLLLVLGLAGCPSNRPYLPMNALHDVTCFPDRVIESMADKKQRVDCHVKRGLRISSSFSCARSRAIVLLRKIGVL